MSAPFPSKAELGAAFQRINDQASGLLVVEAVLLEDMPGLFIEALAGNANALRVLRMVRQSVDRIERAPKNARMLCASCPRSLRQGRYIVAAAFPSCDDPAEGMAMAVCDRCASTREQAVERATFGLRRVWPDLRPIAVTHPEGGKA